MTRWSKWLLITALALLALNALSYGGYFVSAPWEARVEFGIQADAPVQAEALHLVRLAGVGLLSFFAFALLAIIRLARGKPGGLAITAVLAMTYLGIAAAAWIDGRDVDAAIYGGFGIVIAALAAWRQSVQPPPTDI